MAPDQPDGKVPEDPWSDLLKADDPDTDGSIETIFANLDVLDPNDFTYLPKSFPERKEQLTQLKDIFKPFFSGDNPRHAIVFGPTGQGKTAVLKSRSEVLSRWADENGRPVTVVWFSCDGASSSYAVISSLIKVVREIRNGPGEVPPTGYNVKRMFSMLISELQAIGGSFLIILDEIEAIGDDDYILYELTNSELPVKVGIIGVTNDYQFQNQLREKTQSRLGNRTVHFSKYDSKDLQSILSRRAEAALKNTYFVGEKIPENLHSEVLDPGVIGYCGAKVAKETGNARTAIELFQMACELADNEPEQYVTISHAERAEKYLNRKVVNEGIITANSRQHVTLLAMATLLLRHEGNEFDTKEIYDAFLEIASTRVITEEISLRTFERQISELYTVGILNRRYRSRGADRGTTHTWSLDVKLKRLLTQLELGGTAEVSEFANELLDEL